jgi:hypothetical protein
MNVSGQSLLHVNVVCTLFLFSTFFLYPFLFFYFLIVFIFIYACFMCFFSILSVFYMFYPSNFFLAALASYTEKLYIYKLCLINFAPKLCFIAFCVSKFFLSDVYKFWYKF